jgi:four helix bundle protein
MWKRRKRLKVRRTLSVKFSVSLKEARETVYWLRLLKASGRITTDELRLLSQEADEISRILGAIIVRTKNRPKAK